MDIRDDLEEEPTECPGKSDLLLALEVLQKFSLFSTNGSSSRLIKPNINKNFTKNEKQTTINEFFKL